MSLRRQVLRNNFLMQVNRQSKRRIILFYSVVLFCLVCLSTVQDQLATEVTQKHYPVVQYETVEPDYDLPVRSNQRQSGDPGQRSLRSPVDFFSWVATPSGYCRKLVSLGGCGSLQRLDGNKYVCLDSHVLPAVNSCLLYSFGMDLDITFEDSFWNFRKCEEHLHDPNMATSGWLSSRENLLRGQHFHNTELSTKNNEGPYYFQKQGEAVIPVYRRTLDALVTDHNNTGRRIDYLKMDIEGAEWKVFQYLVKNHLLKEVQQIQVEFHSLDLKNSSKEEVMKTLQERYDILVSIEEEGFRRVFIEDNRHHLCKVDFRRFMEDNVGNNSTSKYSIVDGDNNKYVYSLCQEILFIREKLP